jgi:hypothetical protein
MEELVDEGGTVRGAFHEEQVARVGFDVDGGVGDAGADPSTTLPSYEAVQTRREWRDQVMSPSCPTTPPYVSGRGACPARNLLPRGRRVRVRRIRSANAGVVARPRDRQSTPTRRSSERRHDAWIVAATVGANP